MQQSSRRLFSCMCQTCGSDELRAKQRETELENPQASYWRHTWRINGTPGWTLTGHSRALERTGFFIDELGVYLDAGVAWKNPTCNPQAILVTHGHIDHINALPMLLRCGDADPAVFVPFEHINNVREMTRMTWSVKREDNTPGAGSRVDVADKPGFVDTLIQRSKPGDAPFEWAAFAEAMPVEEGALRDSVPEKEHLQNVKGRMWIPTIPGIQYLLPGKKKTVVRTVHCFHTTTDVGYVVCETVKTLRGASADAEAEYCRLRELSRTDKSAGKQIGEMRKQGLLVSAEDIVPRVAYLLDTTAQVLGPCEQCAAGQAGCSFLHSEFSESCFGYLEAGPGVPRSFDSRNPNKYEGGSRNPNQFTFAAQTELIFACATIVIECSFIGTAGMSDEDADREAKKRGHTSWTQIEPLARQHPQSTFVLVHFSKRYTDAEIRNYFDRRLAADSADTAMRNVVLWLDSGVVDFHREDRTPHAQAAA